MHKAILSALLALCSVTANASSWKVFSTHSDVTLIFYDSETVEKKDDTVTVWIKYVQESSAPDSDGSFSRAQRNEYSCKKRKYQILMSSLYDKDHKFIRSYPTAGIEKDIVPESIGDGLLKAVCSKDFPENSPPVKDNDIYEYAISFFDYIKKSKVDMAPK